MLQLRTILHPTDFSDRSQAAFQLACSLARQYGSRLLVLHVGAPQVMLADDPLIPPQPLVSEPDRPVLEAQLRKLLPPEPKVALEHCLLYGATSDQILETADLSRADLIVMGTHGRTGFGRALVGSVAEQILRRAACPVLTVKAPSALPQAPLAIRTILLPTDFSERSQFAFPLACALARDQGARLTFLHVHETSATAYGGAFTKLALEASRDTASRQLAQLKPTDPQVPCEHWLVEGDPAGGILQAAQSRPCDLIVMGTHGRTGLGRLLMGSVTEQVVRKAPCPVLTLRAPFATSPFVTEPVPTGVGAGAS